MGNDKMGIKRLDHVCWAVQSVEDVLPLLTELMGMTVEGRFENAEVGFRGVGCGYPVVPATSSCWSPTAKELSAPLPARRGPGLHHVTFEVADIDRAAAAIRDFGIEPMGGVQRSHGWAETYIHPKDSGGVLFQFYVEEEPHDHPHDDEQVSHSHEYGAPK